MAKQLEFKTHGTLYSAKNGLAGNMYLRGLLLIVCSGLWYELSVQYPVHCLLDSFLIKLAHTGQRAVASKGPACSTT